MSATATSNDRFSFRVDPEIKQTIERAAAARGQSLTDFAISTLSREAEEILRTQQVLILSDADRNAFLNALDHPPKPNAKMLRAAKRFRAARSRREI